MSNQHSTDEDQDWENMVLVKGFDLVFDQICAEDLQKIALDLGGDSSFDVESQIATYMFSNAVYLDLNKLHEGHRIADVTGKYFSYMYDCRFIASELYLGVSEKQFNALRKSGL